MIRALGLAALCLACLAGGGFASAEDDFVRAEFWTELAANPWDPAASSSAEAEEKAAREMLDEAAFVFSGMFGGFEFEWEPRDSTRGRKESFSLRSLGSLLPGDPRLEIGPAFAREGSLRAYVEFRPDAADLRLREIQSGPRWRSSQGLGYAPLEQSVGGRRAAYEDAVRAGIDALMRGILPNRPRLVRGRAAFAAVPSIAIVEGRYLVKARLRIEPTEILNYSP